MVQANEMINLLLTLAGTILFIVFSRGYARPPFRLLYLGFMLVLLASLFTVLEGLFWFSVFNILEHASLMLAGFFFLGEVVRLIRQENRA